ncbi:MAG: hypothetical protein JO257_02835 [Deltaproteobacteria bacterium]|nr:hypothetical protein [Deltaproteobacteria bacterium]
MRILIALLIVPAIAAANPAKTAEQKHSDDCAAARKANKTCVLDMGKEEVTGDKPVGTGVGVAVIKIEKEPSMISIRRDFIVEILKSAEDID